MSAIPSIRSIRASRRIIVGLLQSNFFANIERDQGRELIKSKVYKPRIFSVAVFSDIAVSQVGSVVRSLLAKIS